MFKVQARSIFYWLFNKSIRHCNGSASTRSFPISLMDQVLTCEISLTIMANSSEIRSLIRKYANQSHLCIARTRISDLFEESVSAE